MNVITQSPSTLNVAFESKKSVKAQPHEQFVLLQGILESLPDGILIVSENGNLLQSNRLGRHLCEQILGTPMAANSVPDTIWRLCEALLDSRETFSEAFYSHFQIEDDIQQKDTLTIRVRVQWLNQDPDDSRLLVVLEDRLQAALNRAIAESRRYGLTDREFEVWKHRSIGCTYKQISQKLFITVDTVKKHVKNIHAKRETFQIFNEEEES